MSKIIHLTILIVFSFLFFSNCNNLDTISYSPPLTPEKFLEEQHWIKVEFGDKSFILSQPSSSFFVYLLSLFYFYVGYLFWKNYQDQKSRYWWSIGFFLTGIAAVLAGTSYQAFGYELKCTGREFCRWTTWWEIHYEILQNAGMNAFVVATAYTNAKGRYRMAIIYYAILNSAVYAALVIYGSIVPIQFLISFEFLELSCLPAVILFLSTSIYEYIRMKDAMNLHLSLTWVFLILVMIGYIFSLEINLTAILWEKGIWFTENDVLHVGLIFWVIYIIFKLPKTVVDIKG